MRDRRVLLRTGCLLGLIWLSGHASAADRFMTGEQLLERPIDVELDPTDLDRSLLKIARATGAVLCINSIVRLDDDDPLPKRLTAPSLRDGLKTIIPHAFRGTRWTGPTVIVSSPEEARRPPEHRSDDRSLFRSGAWMVRGPVVDETGRRLSGALIRLTCWPHVVYTATDREGRFAAQVPINGTSELTVHARDEFGMKQAWVQVPKEDGAIIEEPMKLVLRAPRTVTIEVRDSAGHEVPDANVVVLAGGYPTDAPRTDARGKSLFLAPESMAISCIAAWKPGVGLEMTGSESGSSTRRQEESVDVTQPVVLKLTKRQPISFRIVDSNDRPLEGIDVSPWMLVDEKRKAGLNFATMRGRGARRTGADGIVTFDFFPEWQTQSLRFSSTGADRIRYLDETVDLSRPVEQPIKVIRDEYVPVSGVVMASSGKTCPGAAVTAIADTPMAGGSAVTDEAGRYELLLEPGHPYLVVARGDEIGEVSAPQDGIVVRHNEPQRDLMLQLRRGIRLFGTLGAARMRLGRSDSLLRLVTDREPLEGRQTPLANAPQMSKPGVYVDLKPNTEGQFEVLVGPGSYELVPDRNATPVRFVLTDEDEYKLRVPPPPPATRDLPGLPRPGRRPD